MQQRTFLKSLNDAFEGFVYVVQNEKNMRIHFLIGFIVLLCGILLGVTRMEWIILCTVSCFVWAAEMFNTLIEETMDFVQGEFHPAVRVIKDVSAGIVLIAVMNSIIVGFLIFSKYLSWPLQLAITHIRYSPLEVTFLAVLVVVFIVIAAKAFFHRGTPLVGGIVSGHAAIAFSLWAAVILNQDNIFVSGITLLLALLVVQSRIRAKIHTFWESAAGAALGIAVTALLFKFLR
jgi:diacylglycerol kinase (ATP)